MRLGLTPPERADRVLAGRFAVEMTGRQPAGMLTGLQKLSTPDYDCKFTYLVLTRERAGVELNGRHAARGSVEIPLRDFGFGVNADYRLTVRLERLP